MTEAFIRQYADSVLQICTFYLGRGDASEHAFSEAFYRAGHDCSRSVLYRETRKVCRKMSNVYISPDEEESLYSDYLGLDRAETMYIVPELYEREDVSKLSILHS